MTRGWQGLVGLVLVASAVPLVQVGYDRSAPPRQSLVLTHRELMPGWNRDENTGVTLTWSWAHPPELDSVPLARLTALGLHCGPGTYECDIRGGRRGWIVVGIDSGRYDAQIDSLRARIDSIHASHLPDTVADHRIRSIIDQLKELVLRNSRLVMVDVGTDPAPLAERWNDGQHLVLSARIRGYRQTWPRDTLPGEVPFYRINADPLPSTLYVPERWAAAVEDTTGMRQQMYEVEIAVGRRWLPRVVRVTRLPDPKWPVGGSE